ncbi:MAG TPA: protein kinase, partial [Isosphaeraceae bacterium]
MSLCPSDEDFVRLLREQLDGNDQDRIVAHVQRCPVCRERLEGLTPGRLAPADGRHEADVGADPHATTAPGPADPFATADPTPPDPYATADPDTLSPLGPMPDEGPVVADYEILAELGHGGMGVVYRARQRSLNRAVALKMIRHGSRARPDQLARFRIEAEAVARLHHANIVQIYDIGEAEGLPFFSLELLPGGSLAERLAGTPQPEATSAALLVTLARAMHAAHGAGIVHRDLKPANVLFDADGTPKITDFGLAKRLEHEDGQTQTGQVMGTPSYMAPEQAGGRVAGIGPPTDVYALGAILYEMLTGRPPFKGATPMETLRQVLDEEPVPPSRLRPRISRDVETICLKCLAKDPRRRYADAAELADDLDRYRAGEPIRARRTPPWERGLKWSRRHPTAATLLATAATLLIGLIGAWAWYLRWAQARDRREVQRIASLRVEAVDGLFRAREALGHQDHAGGKELVGKLLGKIEHEASLSDLAARARDLLGQLNRGLARASVAEAVRARAEADRARYRRFQESRFAALYHETQFNGLDPTANRKATRAAARAALGAFAPPGHDDSWTLPPAPPATLGPRERDAVAEGCYELMLVLAEAEAHALPGEDPRRQVDLALRILDGAARLRPAPSRAYHLRRAACLEQAQDAAGAEHQRRLADVREPTSPFDHFLTGLERYKRNDGPAAARAFDAVLQEQPDHFWSLCLLGICQVNAQRPGEARGLLYACLQQRPDVPWLYLLRGFASGQMGVLLLQQAEALPARADRLRAEATALFEDAEADYRKAADRLAGTPDDELHYILRVNRGVLRLQRRLWDDARADLLEAIRLDPSKYHPYDALAQIDQEQGRLDDALARLTEAIARAADLADLYRKRARLHARLRAIEPALSDLDAAILRAAPGSPEQAHDHAERGRLLHGGGRLDEALAAYDAARKVLPKDAEVHRLRADVLLKLKRYDEVIGACDVSLAGGPPSADLHLLRGLARAARNDLPGAIEDYTQSLALRPGTPRVHVDRGWAYLFSAAPKLALRDFDAAIRLDPADGDAYSGRGNARVLLGQYRPAVADALEALRRGEPGAKAYYNAARILAQAAALALGDGDRRGLSAVQIAGGYLDRAQAMLRQALEALP